MLNSSQNKKFGSDLFQQVVKLFDNNLQSMKASEIDSLCEQFIFECDSTELKRFIEQINKVNLSLHVNLIYLLINKSISLNLQGKITYDKLFILIRSVLQLPYTDPTIVTKILGESLAWLKNGRVGNKVVHSYFEMIFTILSYSDQAHNHFFNTFPILLATHVSNRRDHYKSDNNTLDLHNEVIDYIHSEAEKDSISNRQLRNYLKFLIKYYISLHREIEKENLFWYLIARNMSTHELNNSSFIYNPIDLDQTNILSDIAELHHVLYKILHALPEDTSANIIAKVLFSFSGLVMNSFGLQFMMDILSSWYDLEENVTFRLGFHLTYISIIRYQNQNPEMTLNFTSHIVFKERDPDLLIQVIFNLYDLGINWDLIYPFIILPLIHNNDISSDLFREKISQIYKIYSDDLQKSVNGKLLSQTEDLYLIFWMISNEKQKKQMIIPLKKWLDSTEKTNTIKGTFIKSLILRTSEPSWINALNRFFESLGRMSVEILDDFEFYNTSILKIYDHDPNHLNLLNSAKLNSFIRNDYCMACKARIEKGKSQENFCEVCKFSFCSECCATGQVFLEDHFCLGSALSGFKHTFKKAEFNST